MCSSSVYVESRETHTVPRLLYYVVGLCKESAAAMQPPTGVGGGPAVGILGPAISCVCVHMRLPSMCCCYGSPGHGTCFGYLSLCCCCGLCCCQEAERESEQRRAPLPPFREDKA